SHSAASTRVSDIESTVESIDVVALGEATRREFVEHRGGSYRFFHDRILEAAYSLIPEQTLDQTHLLIGRLLVSHTP
ncbi:hypothetical protein ACCS66_39115, partial [Rhizobium ruizarguesonis]